MKEDYSIVFAGICLLILVLLGTGYYFGVKDTRTEAVKNGCAWWSADKDGHAVFQWRDGRWRTEGDKK